MGSHEHGCLYYVLVVNLMLKNRNIISKTVEDCLPILYVANLWI